MREINSPNLRLQLDIFHLQRIKGSVEDIEKYLPITGNTNTQFSKLYRSIRVLSIQIKFYCRPHSSGPGARQTRTGHPRRDQLRGSLPPSGAERVRRLGRAGVQPPVPDRGGLGVDRTNGTDTETLKFYTFYIAFEYICFRTSYERKHDDMM